MRSKSRDSGDHGGFRPPASKRLFFVGTDNYHAGQIGGERLAKEMNGKGSVVVFTIPEQAQSERAFARLIATRLRPFRKSRSRGS